MNSLKFCLILSGLTNLSLLVSLLAVIWDKTRREKELFDRLMARDFVEFKSLTQVARPKTFKMDDATEHALEQKRLAKQHG